MKRLLITAPLLAGLVVSVTACSSVTRGEAQSQPFASTPASSSTGGMSSHSSVTASSSSQPSKGRGKLAEIDVCKLITRQEGQNYQINRVERVDVGGAKGCEYYTADSKFVLGIGIRERQGLNGFDKGYGKVTNTAIAKYSAKKQLTPGRGCLIAIGFTDSSSIDVSVRADGGTARSCQLSTEFAELVASKVTPG